MRFRNRIIQCLSACKSSCTLQRFWIRSVRRTFRQGLIRMRAITRIVVNKGHFQIVISRSKFVTWLTNYLYNVRQAPIRLGKEASTMDTQSRGRSTLIIQVMESVILTTIMYRVRMIHRFKVFQYSHVSTFCAQRSAWFLARITRTSVFLFRITFQIFGVADGLRIKRSRTFYFLRRVFERIFSLVMDERCFHVICSIFRFFRRPQDSLKRFISTICHMTFFGHFNRNRSARINQINRHIIRIVRFRIIITSRAIRTLSSRARAFLRSFLRTLTSQRGLTSEFRTQASLTTCASGLDRIPAQSLCSRMVCF